MSNEPKQLSHGKAFHKLIQQEWADTAEGEVAAEHSIVKLSGRNGRIDIFVKDDGDNLVAVAEIKASNWDKMSESAVKRNVRRQIKQIWDYIESQLKQAKDVSPGIIFQERPSDKARLKLIEDMFDEEGIPVVWHDESIEERKARSVIAGLNLTTLKTTV